MEKVFLTLEELNEEYIRVWEEVCNIESPTDYKEGVDAVCKYFCDRARARGWKVEEFAQEKWGNVACITMNPDAAQITQAGIPCIDNLGTAGGDIHTNYEYGKLDSLQRAATRIAAAIYKI